MFCKPWPVTGHIATALLKFCEQESRACIKRRCFEASVLLLGGVYMRKLAPVLVSYRDDFLISYRVYMMMGHFISRLCISQFQLRPAPSSVNSSYAQPPPPPGYWGAFARLVSPGGGAFAKFALPGAGHLPTPGPLASFSHSRSFLSENSYTEGFTGKKADWLTCQGQE